MVTTLYFNLRFEYVLYANIYCVDRGDTMYEYIQSRDISWLDFFRVLINCSKFPTTEISEDFLAHKFCLMQS